VEEKIKLLLDKFYKWYETSKFHVGRINYAHPFSKEFVLNSSNSELLEAISNFAKEGGGIQSSGQRTEPMLRKSVEENIVEFRKYLLSIWEQDFDLVKWFDNQEFKGWGKGVKTIFLHRIFPNKYVPYNNKSVDGLKILGFFPETRGATEGEKYLNCLNAFNQIIKFDPVNMDINKVDALMHYIIGTDEGQSAIRELFGISDKKENKQNDLETLIKNYADFKNSPAYDEQYKWDYAIKNQNIFENLDNLKEKISNYLGAPNFQSYFIRNSGLKWVSERFPEQLHNSFSILFNEAIELKERIEKFREIIKRTLDADDGWKSKNLADPKVETASFLLFTNNYKKYMLFTQITPFKNYAKKLGIDSLLKYETPEERYSNWQNYCLNELIPVMNKVLDKDNTLLDAQDFIWYVGNASNNDLNVIIKAEGNINNSKKKYWMYAPGENSYLWDTFYNQNIMGIGWNDLGDLSQYSSKEDIKSQMKRIYGEGSSYKNDGHATWQFANEMNIGDIVFVKNGRDKIIGRGIVESDYIFDETRSDYKNIRKAKWTHKGEWEHEGQIVLKTLTDITPYTEYCKKLENIFSEDLIEDAIDVFEPYSEEDFLEEVFISTEKYETLKNLLKNKKNVILQGAPGVGKTFVAKRLAYSIIGKKDTSRVKMVQFHQSYGYEDFIMGYRPSGSSFDIKYGPFYEFCKEAEKDNENDYFFIIDEINRGNLSKIFGELLMLIETDKRNESIRLLYKDEQFSVPDNVHIIGMMNTADRSLAIIDYALRRRFSFFDFEPAFEDDGFKEYQIQKNNEKFNNLIQVIKSLNKAISEDNCLGEGFRIGHSYFCTDNSIDEIWFNSVINYEIIPLLKEYWFDEPDKITNWSEKLKSAIK